MTLLVLFVFIGVCVAQTSFGTQRPGEACTVVAQCLQDYYGCQSTTCQGGLCTRSNRPAGTACANTWNYTNFDACNNFGTCIGKRYNNTWVRVTMYPVATAPPLRAAYQFFDNLQAAVFQQLAAVFVLPTTAAPAIRTCLERGQRLNVVVNPTTGQQVIVPCLAQDILLDSVDGQYTYAFWMEFLDAPPVNNAGQTKESLAAYFINQVNIQNYTNFFLRAAQFDRSPFDVPTVIPYDNAYLLGIAIGVACGCFILSLLGCVMYYAAKSRREVYGAVPTTDSTASVQSGSSIRSDMSQASADQSDIAL